MGSRNFLAKQVFQILFNVYIFRFELFFYSYKFFAEAFQKFLNEIFLEFCLNNERFWSWTDFNLYFWRSQTSSEVLILFFVSRFIILNLYLILIVLASQSSHIGCTVWHTGWVEEIVFGNNPFFWKINIACNNCIYYIYLPNNIFLSFFFFVPIIELFIYLLLFLYVDFL